MALFQISLPPNYFFRFKRKTCNAYKCMIKESQKITSETVTDINYNPLLRLQKHKALPQFHPKV